MRVLVNVVLCRMVDCIFGLCSVAADGMIVDVIGDVISDCNWKIGSWSSGTSVTSSMRRYSAVESRCRDEDRCLMSGMSRLRSGG